MPAHPIQSWARRRYTGLQSIEQNRHKRHPDHMPLRRPHEPVTPRIVVDSETRRYGIWVVGVAGMIALALWSWLTFDYAQRQAGVESRADTPALAALIERVDQLEHERSALQAESTRHARDGQVDRETAESLNRDIANLRADLQTLKNEVAVLRQRAGGGRERLMVKEFRLTATPNPAEYRYAFTLTRAGTGDRRMEGAVSLTLNGERAGAREDLTVTDSDQRLGFRQFQTVEGELLVPDDFMPRHITINITPSADQFQPARLVFDWQPVAG